VPKVRMSFEQTKKNLLKRMISKKTGKPVDQVIRFRNNDVPTYLRGLDEFEKRSKKCRVLVK